MMECLPSMRKSLNSVPSVSICLIFWSGGMYLIPALGKPKQEDYHKASPGHMASTGPAVAT